MYLVLKVTKVSSIPSGSLHESDAYTGELTAVQQGKKFLQNWVRPFCLKSTAFDAISIEGVYNDK